jgi:hypothetical protein
MNPEELQRKLEGAADRVGEAGQEPVNYIRNNTKTFAIAFAVVCVAVVILYNLAS